MAKSTQTAEPKKKTAEAPSSKTEEVQINAWIPKELMKRLKSKALNEDKNLKASVIEALENYVAG